MAIDDRDTSVETEMSMEAPGALVSSIVRALSKVSYSEDDMLRFTFRESGIQIRVVDGDMLVEELFSDPER